MKIKLPILSLLLILLNSCTCSCDCEKNFGCKVMHVELRSNYQVIMTKAYCSQNNFYSDQALQDSVNAFYSRYRSDSTYVYSRDSIYLTQEIEHRVKCDERDFYTSQGFYCSCYR